MNVLLCGQRAFAAKGLKELLIETGHDVDCFSRGELQLSDHDVSGNIYEMSSNPYLDKAYDVVINFILVKGGSVEDNLKYAEALASFCKSHHVKNLIHISSISVYSNTAEYIDEDSEIESDYRNKGGYGSLKVAIDLRLKELMNGSSCHLTFVRPGFIIEDVQKVSLAGIALKTPLGYVLMGDKKTSMPLIERSLLHEALVRIVNKTENVKSVYLVLENNHGTKYMMLKKRGISPILLPKCLILTLGRIAKSLHLLNTAKYSQIQGLFKNTYFDSSETEYEVGFSFQKNSTCVMGAGAYGSYTIQTLSEKYPDLPINLLDVGNGGIKDEDEIGYKTNLLGKLYNGLKKGRFFGLGGASAKWGGQLLTFTKNDFANPTPFMADIVRIDEKYMQKMFQKFKISNDFKEEFVTKELFEKVGVWLGYFSRNLFAYFKIGDKLNVNVIEDARVTKVVCEGNTVKWVEYLKNGKLKHGVYEHYFMTAGAFESNRIMLNSGLTPSDSVTFSDHLDQRIFKVHSNGTLGEKDFSYQRDGSSLITRRVIGEIDGISFYSMPNFNADFPFFQNVKKIMFAHDFRLSVFGAILKDLPSVIAFAWCLAFKKKIYVYKNEWYLIIDIENPKENSHIRLSKELDKYGQPGLDVNFEVGEQATELYDKAKEIMVKYLDENHVKYDLIDDEVHVEKCEDAYHPFGMFLSESKSLDDYFNHFSNMLVLNTGILPRTGGINSTASVFPLIEEYVSRMNLS